METSVTFDRPQDCLPICLLFPCETGGEVAITSKVTWSFNPNTYLNLGNPGWKSDEPICPSLLLGSIISIEKQTNKPYCSFLDPPPSPSLQFVNIPSQFNSTHLNSKVKRGCVKATKNSSWPQTCTLSSEVHLANKPELLGLGIFQEVTKPIFHFSKNPSRVGVSNLQSGLTL